MAGLFWLMLCVVLYSLCFCSCDDCLMYQLFRHPGPWCELDSLVIFPFCWDSLSFPWKPENLEEQSTEAIAVLEYVQLMPVSASVVVGLAGFPV